jgi:hypothetical protein
VKYVIGFGQFWYDFIVGDSVVLAIGGIGGLFLAYLCVAAGAAALAEIVLPVAIVLTIVFSLVH